MAARLQRPPGGTTISTIKCQIVSKEICKNIVIWLHRIRRSCWSDDAFWGVLWWLLT
jgi:hypothetical protein